MLILRRLPRMTVFFVCRKISWLQYKLSVTRPSLLVVSLRKGGRAFIDRDLERAFFGF